MLFDIIQKALPANLALVDVISDLLDVGADASYRRIRGDKPISFEEALKLCRHFQLSFDMLTGLKPIHQFDCMYRPINMSNPNEYINYMQTLSKHVEKLKASHDSSILMSAMDIPVFHILPQKELTLFKVYTWAQSVYDNELCMDDFMKEFEKPEILTCYQKISENYELIPSAEIWMEKTIDATLRLIGYYVDICSFSNKELPLLLCEQLLTILNKLQQWAESGTKGARTTPFQLYVSEMELENTYLLMKQPEVSNCAVKLYTINSLNIFDQEFCRETENWLDKLAQRSTLLCGSSEKERVKFFHSQRQKIQFLIEKIQKSF